MILVRCASVAEDFDEVKEFFDLHKGDGIDSIPDDKLKTWVNNGEVLFLRGGLHPPLTPAAGSDCSKGMDAGVDENKGIEGKSVDAGAAGVDKNKGEGKSEGVSAGASLDVGTVMKSPILIAGRFTYDCSIPLGMIQSEHPLPDQCVCISDNGPTLQNPPFNDANTISKLLMAPETLTSYVGSLIAHKEHRTENLLNEAMKFYIETSRHKLTRDNQRNYVQCFALYRDRGLPWLWNKYVSYVHDGFNSANKSLRWHCARFANPDRVFFVLMGIGAGSPVDALRSCL